MREQGRSGQNVAAFCRERGLWAPQFYAWRKRLREAAAGREEPGGARGLVGLVESAA